MSTRSQSLPVDYSDSSQLKDPTAIISIKTGLFQLIVLEMDERSEIEVYIDA